MPTSRVDRPRVHLFVIPPRSGALLLAALIALPVIGASPAAAARSAAEVAGPAGAAATLAGPRLLVRFRPGTTVAGRDAALRSVGAELDGGVPALGVVRIVVPSGRADALAAHPAVHTVEREGTVTLTLAPDDAFYADDPFVRLGQWGIRRAYVDRAWDLVRGGPALTVAVLDTGVDAAHPDLQGALAPGRSFVSAPSAGCGGSAADENGHGTAVAGVIAANANNRVGVAGVAFGVRVLPLKVLDCEGLGILSDVANAIIFAVDGGARIVSLSLGVAHDSPVLRAAVRYAAARDVLVVGAVGNCGAGSARCSSANEVSYPAAFPEVLAVAATDTDDTRAPFSTQAAYVAIAAPGRSIVSTVPTYVTRIGSIGYGALSGTSLATPFVAGVAALIWARFPLLTAAEVRERLIATADDLGAAGTDSEFGAGRVNALRALTDPATAGPAGVAAGGWGASYTLAPVPALLPGGSTPVALSAQNTGTRTWRASGPSPTLLAVHLTDIFGVPLLWDGERTALGADVAPGGTVAAEVTVAAPLAPGAYRARVDLVEEGVAWASSGGAAPADRVFVVAPDLRASLPAGPLTVSRAVPEATVSVTNISALAWTPTGAAPVRVSSHWLDASGGVLVWDGPRAELPRTVLPGETVTISVPLGAIPVGATHVVIDLVADGYRWFGAGTARPVTLAP